MALSRSKMQHLRIQISVINEITDLTVSRAKGIFIINKSKLQTAKKWRLSVSPPNLRLRSRKTWAMKLSATLPNPYNLTQTPNQPIKPSGVAFTLFNIHLNQLPPTYGACIRHTVLRDLTRRRLHFAIALTNV